jgi:hypothetical protein
MAGGPRARPGTYTSPRVRVYSRQMLIMSSSLRSNSSKKIPPLSLPAAQKKKSAENVGVNRAIPGPGDEVEAEPDAGVLDSEKVTVVFLVSCLVPSVHVQADKFSASKYPTTHLFQRHTMLVPPRALKPLVLIRSWLGFLECVSPSSYLQHELIWRSCQGWTRRDQQGYLRTDQA